VWTVDGKTFEGGAGDIFVIKAGEIHSRQLAIRCWYNSTSTLVTSLYPGEPVVKPAATSAR
jgi:hypothetical protein